MPVLCQACEARHRGVCGALNGPQLQYLNAHSSRREVNAGTELVADAESVANYSNILSGVVKLTKILADGRRQIVGLQFAPDFLGRPFRKSSEINAESATKVQLCSFPTAMVTLGRKIAAENVASFLHLIATNVDPTVEGSGNVCFDLGLTIETVSRQITKLRKAGVIKVENNRHVTVPTWNG